MSSATSCFDDSTAARMLRGDLPPERLRELEAHAASCAGCAARLARAGEGSTSADSWDALTRQDSAARAPPNRTAAPPAPAAAPVPHGARIGRFIVLDQLGEGGMGRVLRAYDPQLDRRVAIKLLRSDVGSASRELAQARLLREAQAMARASHPNLVTIFDAGTEGDQVFLAMELVEGETLEGWLKKPHPWREVVRLFLDAARGLAAAHAAGLVHRDFKPANVLVHPEGRAVVTDFGIAHLVASTGPTAPVSRGEHESGAHEKLTGAGNVVGTPRYMSPEQYEDLPLDGRSDQFSFSVALYEALSGQLPFEGRKLDERLLHMQRGEVRPPPPDASAPKWLWAALQRGLAFTPDQRFPSLDALIAHFERRLSRRRLKQGAAVALGLLAVGGAVASAAFSSRPAPCQLGPEELGASWNPTRAAELQRAFAQGGGEDGEALFRSTRTELQSYAEGWVAMRRDACLATRVRGTQSEPVLQLRMLCLDRRRSTLQALVGLLAKGDPPVLARGAEAAANLPPLAGCADVAHLALEDEGETAAERAAGEPLRAGLDSANALLLAGQAKATRAAVVPLIARARAAKSRASLAEALYVLGRAASQSHDMAAARPALTEALQLALETKHDGLAADAAASLVFATAEDPAASALAVPLATGVVARAGSPAYADSFLHHGMGAAAYAAGRYTEAAAEFARAAEIATEKLGPSHPRTLSSLIAEAEALSLTHDASRALALSQRVLAAQEKLLGPENSRLVPTLMTVADQLIDRRRHEEARALLARAAKMCRRDFAAGSSAENAIIERQAEVESGEGHDALAEKLLRRALASQLALDHAEGPSTAEFRAHLARVLLHEGALAEAEQQARSAVEVFGRADAKSPDLAGPLTALGEIALARNDSRTAREALERALSLQSNVPPLDDARTRFALARAVGHTERGQRLATEAQKLAGDDPLAAAIGRWLQGAADANHLDRQSE